MAWLKPAPRKARASLPCRPWQHECCMLAPAPAQAIASDVHCSTVRYRFATAATRLLATGTGCAITTTTTVGAGSVCWLGFVEAGPQLVPNIWSCAGHFDCQCTSGRQLPASDPRASCNPLSPKSQALATTWDQHMQQQDSQLSCKACILLGFLQQLYALQSALALVWLLH